MNTFLLKSLPVLLLGTVSLSACAQPPAPAPAGQAAPGTAAARATAALKKIDPNIKVDSISAAPVSGFQQAVVGGQVLYVSNDGKYLMQGTLYDIENRRDAGASALAGMRKALLAQIPLKDRIVFAPGNPKHTVTVFSDVECGYCRKLHSEIAEYNRLGIAIEYMAFPRMGLGSQDHRDMISVWCASDRKQALTDAKSDKPIAAKDCKSPVDMEYHIGQRLGISGTPAIFAPDGTQLGGYLPPQQLREALDKLAGAGQAGAPAGMP